MKTEKLKIGQRVKVISGGLGCLIANDVIGIITTRKGSIAKGNYYQGEYTTVKAPLYIKGNDGVYYGLCEGYEVELLTQENE